MNRSAETAWWKHPRSRRTAWVSAAVVMAGLLVWYFRYYPYVSTDDARVTEALIRVAPEGAGGKVTAVNVKDGSRVTRGDVLAELDHGVAAANLMKAKAHAGQMEREGGRMERLAAQHGVAARDLDSSRAALQMAKSDLTLAQIAYDR